MRRMEYVSPRLTTEFMDCSMPMTFDTYSVCGFSCLYCFAWFLKSHQVQGYLQRHARAVDVEKVKWNFLTLLARRDEQCRPHWWRNWGPYVRERYVMQWGGLADPFDPIEERLGVTLELMRFFDGIDYPLSFSTKGTFFTEDPRYMELFARHTHNWHVKVSIITLNETKARAVEVGVPSPQERLEAIRRLARLGVHVTLRLRPYIPGISEDWRALISEAKVAGADSVTTEFLCLEQRAHEGTKARYKALSEAAGYDVFAFYRKNSPRGYMRLSPEMKRPIFRAMRDHAHSLGLRFHVSDEDGRDFNDAPCCCGVPPEWKLFTAHVGGAIWLAVRHGQVRFSDIRDELYAVLGGEELLRWYGVQKRNASYRARVIRLTPADVIREAWNRADGEAVRRRWARVLVPVGVDEDRDVIYRYRGDV